MRFWWFAMLAACSGRGCRGCDGPEPDDSADPCSDPATWYTDADGDGHGDLDEPVEACASPDGTVDLGDDCDDTDPDAWTTGSAWLDADEDGYGGVAVENVCGLPTGYASEDGDCDDDDADVHPGAEAICGNGSDDDCDGIADCAAPEGQDPDSVERLTLTGETGGGFGASLLAGRDLSGDGVLDLAVGAPTTDGVGAAYVFVGPLTDAQQAATRLVGALDDGEAGAYLTSGDLDGDGATDLVVTVKEGRAAEGGASIYIVHGPLPAEGTLGLGEDLGVIIAGSGLGVYSGVDLVRNDADDLFTSNAGQALLFAGPITNTEEDYADIEDGYLSVNSSDTGQVFLTVGDVTGDGVLDTVIGAPQGSAGAEDDDDLENAGNIYLIDDPDSMLLDIEAHAGPGDIASAVVIGEHTDARFGASVAPAGDVDGDGLMDVLVGSPGYAPFTSYTDTGAAYVITGEALASASVGEALAAASSRTRIYGVEGGQMVGATVVEGTDLDQDGSPDLALGAPGYDDSRGAVFVYYGAPRGELDVTEADVTFNGDGAGDALGSALMTGGDYNGLGLSDLVVGAPGVDGGDGAVYVLFFDRL